MTKLFQLSWLIIINATTVVHLLVARLLAGISTGGIFVLIPLYVSEISDVSVRGFLNSLFLLSLNFGTLLMFIVGAYLDYLLVAKIMIAFPLMFMMIFLLFPETPYYLLKCGKNKKAEFSLKFLRGCKNLDETPEKVKLELLNIAKKVEEDASSRARVSIFNELSSVAQLSRFMIFNYDFNSFQNYQSH